MSEVSQQLHQIVGQLVPDATWDDVRYQVKLRASIDHDLDDIKEGRAVTVETLMAEFGVFERGY